MDAPKQFDNIRNIITKTTNKICNAILWAKDIKMYFYVESIRGGTEQEKKTVWHFNPTSATTRLVKIFGQKTRDSWPKSIVQLRVNNSYSFEWKQLFIATSRGLSKPQDMFTSTFDFEMFPIKIYKAMFKYEQNVTTAARN